MSAVEDAVIIACATDLLLQGRDADARAELRRLRVDDPLPQPTAIGNRPLERAAHASRPSVSPAHLAQILTRDGWRCHYCSRKLVVAGVLELLGILCPEEFPFPPGHHMPVARTHPAAIRVYPNVDHIHAGSLGGSWTEEANLVAACTPCNTLKSDTVGWTTVPQNRDGWNGLVDRYRALVERANVDRQYHRTWLRALNI